MKYLSDNIRHLICVPYSIENLHQMAEDLGIKRCWFHHNHYDIPKKRIDEIQAKTKIVSPRLINRIIQSGCPHSFKKGKTMSICYKCGKSERL